MDVLHYFDHSTKRKSELRELAKFCDIGSRKILKYVRTVGVNIPFTDRTVFLKTA